MHRTMTQPLIIGSAAGLAAIATTHVLAAGGANQTMVIQFVIQIITAIVMYFLKMQPPTPPAPPTDDTSDPGERP